MCACAYAKASKGKFPTCRVEHVLLQFINDTDVSQRTLRDALSFSKTDVAKHCVHNVFTERTELYYIIETDRSRKSLKRPRVRTLSVLFLYT